MNLIFSISHMLVKLTGISPLISAFKPPLDTLTGISPPTMTKMYNKFCTFLSYKKLKEWLSHSGLEAINHS